MEVENFDPKPDLDNANVGMIASDYGEWHIHFPFLFTAADASQDSER